MVRHQVNVEAPILAEVRHTQIHEGESATMTRADASTDKIEFVAASAGVTIRREEMRRVTVEQLRDRIISMARQIAEHQSRTMFERLGEAIDEVGNAVSASEIGDKEAFLEMERRLQTDFDPKTLQPKNQIMVIHPSQLERWKQRIAEWEADPDFQEKHAKIREEKLEEWRARENRRKLAD